MSPAKQPIRIAIVGGGLAGASLIYALLAYPHLDVHIFESASAFKESGMAIGFARNAAKALELIGPGAMQCLERAGAVPQHGVSFRLAQGPHAGVEVDRIESSEQRLSSVVHRAAFLHELLADIPPDRMHASKKLLRVSHAADQPVELYFEDGTSHTCDILIGADGIHSTVRKMVLGETDPASSPVYSGWWNIISLQPYEKMQAILGKEYVNIDEPRQYGWFGNGAFMLHDVLSGGALVQFIATVWSEDAGAQWPKQIKVAELKKIFSDWPSQLRHALGEVLGEVDSVPAYCLRDHPPARTYASGQVCITGDAAHASTPWQGSGGGVSIEDSLILSTLLGHAQSPAEAIVALSVYDSTRRPRTLRVVESSKASGLIMTGQNSEYPLDLTLRGRLPSRWDFILKYDVAKAQKEAVHLMDLEMRKCHRAE